MYYQERIETMDQEILRALQLERAQAMIAYLYDHISFYQHQLDEARLSPADLRSLEDLSQFPLTVKQDLRDNYPFGLFAVAREEVARIHCSSGTTGIACVVGYTQKDLENWGDCFARWIYAAGGSPQSLLQVSYGYGLFTGGLGAHDGGSRAGCAVLPMSTGNTRRQIRLMRDFGVDILVCTPSYALMIADEALKEGFNPARDFSLTAALLGAEPCSEEMRNEIEEKLGIRVHDIYGISDLMGPGIACECEQQRGLHVCEDQFIVEVVDPKTLKPVPDGEYGELVFTTLTKECSPLLRYRTRDISRILPGRCACGRTHRRIDRIAGRTDDMLIIRGVNVFPLQFAQVISEFPEVTSYYQVILSRRGPLDHVQLNVETVSDFPFDEIRKLEDLERRIAYELKNNLQVSVDVKIVEPRSIERVEAKAKRIIDLR